MFCSKLFGWKAAKDKAGKSKGASRPQLGTVYPEPPEEGEAVGASLSKAFKARFLNLMDAALNCQDVDALKECAKLDEMERLLFRKAYHTRQGMGKWTSRKVYQINTSNIVASFKKRKTAHST